MYDYDYKAEKLFAYKYTSNGGKQFLKEIENSPPINWKEERKYIQIYKSIDSSSNEKTEAIQKIVLGNLQYITVAIPKAVKYTANDEYFMLLNDMVIDLIKSIDNYDVTKAVDGSCLWTYASRYLMLRATTHHLESRKFLHGDVIAYKNSIKLNLEQKKHGHKFSLKEIQELFKCTRANAICLRIWDTDLIHIDDLIYSNDYPKTIESFIDSNNRLDLTHTTTSLDNLIIKDQTKYILKILKNILTDSQYKIIYLRYIEQLSYKQIAKKLGVSVKSVDNKMCLALQHMHDHKDAIKKLLNK